MRVSGKAAHTLLAIAFLSLPLAGCAAAGQTQATEPLRIFAGAASKPPTEEIVALFEAKTGVRVEVQYGGSGAMLAQMRLAGKGDIYFPASSDYMEKAKRAGDVFPESERRVIYLAPAILVERGNPGGIKSLRDLARPGLRVAIANPETAVIGAYAVEIVEKALTPAEREAFRRNVATHAENAEKLANTVSLGAIDATINWSVTAHWDPKRLESIPLAPSEVIRVSYMPIAVSRYTRNRDLAQRFVDFVTSPEGQAIYRKHHYFLAPDEAFAYVGREKPVGGEYAVPAEWIGGTGGSTTR